MPLEGLLWADDPRAFMQTDKSAWRWTAMILQPEFMIHGPGVGAEFAEGPEGSKRYAQAIRDGFGGKVEIKHHDTFSSGDRVAVSSSNESSDAPRVLVRV